MTKLNENIIMGDERVRKVSFFKQFLNRPEFGSISGAFLIFFIFFITAGNSGMFSADGILNWTVVSAYLGILSVGACLLMIAGEFDLSIGSMIGFSGMLIAIPSVFWGWPVWLAILFAFTGSLLLGFINGYIVIKSGLPSFIVSLAFLFILRGLTLALSVIFTDRTIISGVTEVGEGDLLLNLFSANVGEWFFRWLANIGLMSTVANGEPLVTGIPIVVFWWIGLVIVASWVLLKTRYGNWIFASGGDANAARNVGVPADKVKIALFMFTAFCATIYATVQIADIGSAAADRGLLKEFEAIIAAVIGGSLLTGGYGSVVGAAFGALIFGVVQIGITYTDINSDWFRVFLGVMLLIAVLFNNFVRKKVTEAK